VRERDNEPTLALHRPVQGALFARGGSLSRTDAHVPLHVRLARGDLASTAMHDHRDGQECDLPARPELWCEPIPRCRWDFRFTGTRICSCWMCHGSAENRQERRNSRHAGKAQLASNRRSWRGGDVAAFDG